MTFYDKFKPVDYTIKDFKHWIVLLRQKQITLGDAVIVLKRETPSIGNVTKEEMSEFPIVVKWYEEKCKSLFNPEKFNYFAAMMKDNFVHFHSFPRYSTEINRYNILWKDDFYPKPVSLIDVATDESILKMILQDMQEV